MPTVRCPSCKRALNLPESVDIATAQCPLCGATFAAPPSRVEAVPLAAPIPPMPRAVVHEEPGQWSEPQTPFEFPSNPLPEAENREAASARFWLKSAGVIGLIHLFLCSCVSFVFTGRDELLALTYCGSYVFQLIASLVVYNGGNVLQREPASGWATAAAVL